MPSSSRSFTFPKRGSPGWGFVLLAAVVTLAGLSGCATPMTYTDMDYQPGGRSEVPVDQELPAENLQQLVAPIALYADALVAQILTASTFPEQVVLAERWLQAHPDLKGEALGRAVDAQPWDPSIKALTAFPAVLGNMDKNLAWTSSLGEAYTRQPQNVMTTLQDMRRRARAAGTLKSTPQQAVAADEDRITIVPADDNEVFVPAYDPWDAYGDGRLPRQSRPQRLQGKPVGRFVPFRARRCGCLGSAVARRRGPSASGTGRICQGRAGSRGKPNAMAIGGPCVDSSMTSGSQGGTRDEARAALLRNSRRKNRRFLIRHQGHRQKRTGLIRLDGECIHAWMDSSKNAAESWETISTVSSHSWTREPRTRSAQAQAGHEPVHGWLAWEGFQVPGDRRTCMPSTSTQG